jgi:hypothetical protein
MSFILGLIVLIIDIWALLRCWNSSLNFGPKVLWTIIILLFPVLGVIGFILFGRAK